MRKLRKFENYLDEVLVDPKEAANYLNAASKEGEEVFLAALQNVARARGMTALAKKPDYNARVSTRCFRKGEIRDTDRCVRLLTSSAFAWNFVQRRPRDRVLDGGQLLEEIRISWSWSGLEPASIVETNNFGNVIVKDNILANLPGRIKRRCYRNLG